MPETFAISMDALGALKGEQYKNEVYRALYTPDSIKNLDERIIEHLLNSWGELYGVIPLMKSLVIHGQPDVSEKAFDRISDIHDADYESSIYADICKSDERKYGEKIKQVIQKTSDDDLKAEIIVKCVIRTGNPEFIQWYEYVNDKRKREYILNEISNLIPPGFYDKVDPVIAKYRKEIKNN